MADNQQRTARTSSSTSATSLSSNQTYARREFESSISALIRTTEAGLPSLPSERETLRKLATLKKDSQQAKDELKKRLSEMNNTQGAKNTAYRLYKRVEGNATKHTGAFMSALEEQVLSLERLKEQSLNVRLDELGKRIRKFEPEPETELLKNEKALERRENATSDPAEGPVRTGTKSATPSKRSRRPHGSTEGGPDSAEGVDGKTMNGEKEATKDRGGKRTEHAWVRKSPAGAFTRVEYQVRKPRLGFGRDGK